MNKSNKERLGKAIKLQAKAFLLDAAEFFPFGTYINKSNTLIPCSAYAEDGNDRPESIFLINILKGYFIKGIKSGSVMMGAIGLDVTLRENGKVFDVLEIRYFENNEIYIERLKYVVHVNYVSFVGDEKS